MIIIFYSSCTIHSGSGASFCVNVGMVTSCDSHARNCYYCYRTGILNDSSYDSVHDFWWDDDDDGDASRENMRTL